MRKTIYNDLFEVLRLQLSETERYFYVYGMQFRKKAQAKKATAFAGHEIKQFADEFCVEINSKCSELLCSAEKLFLASGRKLSKSQYKHLIAEYTHSFGILIDAFSKTFFEEFETLETIALLFSNLKGNITPKITSHFRAIEILSNSKIDKVLRWTAVSTVLAALSLILSVINLFGS